MFLFAIQFIHRKQNGVIQMAYMNQEKKSKIAPTIKAICKKYGIKGSLSIRNHSSLCLTIKSGVIDFVGNINSSINPMRGDCKAIDYIDVNPYWYHEHFSGVAKECLTEIVTAMNEGNWDHSDIQTDYFNVGWYIDVKIGRWDQPYQLTA
jgi:hypothetical protein